MAEVLGIKHQSVKQELGNDLGTAAVALVTPDPKSWTPATLPTGLKLKRWITLPIAGRASAKPLSDHLEPASALWASESSQNHGVVIASCFANEVLNDLQHADRLLHDTGSSAAVSIDSYHGHVALF